MFLRLEISYSNENKFDKTMVINFQQTRQPLRKKLTVSGKKNAKIFTVSRKRHYPIKTFFESHISLSV